MDSLDPGAFWVVEPIPWEQSISDRMWIMLLTFAGLFVLYSILVIRRAAANVWFFALAASSLPILAGLSSRFYYMRAVKRAIDPNIALTDAGTDWLYWVSSAQHVHILSLVLAAILACMTTYGYCARRKT